MQFTYPRMGGVRQGPQTDRRIIPESRIQGTGKGKVWYGEGRACVVQRNGAMSPRKQNSSSAQLLSELYVCVAGTYTPRKWKENPA